MDLGTDRACRLPTGLGKVRQSVFVFLRNARAQNEPSGVLLSENDEQDRVIRQAVLTRVPLREDLGGQLSGRTTLRRGEGREKERSAGSRQEEIHAHANHLTFVGGKKLRAVRIDAVRSLWNLPASDGGAQKREEHESLRTHQ